MPINNKNKDSRETLTEKLNFFRKELATTSDTERKFELGKKIEELEDQLSPAVTGSHTFTFNRKPPKLPYGLISCNRETEMQKLKDHFKTHQNQIFQHFFIHGQLKDKPESLVERFIHEVLADGSYNFDSHAYKLVEDVKSEHPILNPIELEKTHSLQVAKTDFCKHFQKHFFSQEKNNTHIPSLEAVFQSNLPILQKDYSVWVFKFDDSQKDTILPDLIRWVIESFCCGKSPRIKFLFFYIFEGSEEPNDKRWLSFLGKKKSNSLKMITEKIASEHPCCCHLSGMSSVKTDDILKWFSRHSTDTYPVRELLRKATIDNAQDYDEKDQSFPMEFVEYFIKTKILPSVPPTSPAFS